MDSDLMLNLRNIALFGTIVTATTCSPSLSSRLLQTLAGFKARIKRIQALLRACFAEKTAAGFWEIDMTKFEP